MEVARRFFAGGLGDGSKVEEEVKEKDGPRVWLTKARYEAVEEGKQAHGTGIRAYLGVEVVGVMRVRVGGLLNRRAARSKNTER